MRTYCCNNECPVAAGCEIGEPNHPKQERIGVSPMIPLLKLGWKGDGVGNLGMQQVAERYWCDEYEEKRN